MVERWAKIIDEKKKICDVGIGTDDSYYHSIGYKKMDVIKGIDGKWYISGYEPGSFIPDAKQKRIEELKKLLAKYDYIGVKIATGVSTIEDYKDIIDMCEEYRKEIRILSGGGDVNS